MNSTKGKASIERPWMKYYQEFDGDLSNTKKTLYRYFVDETKKYLDCIAINYFGKKYTYRQMLFEIDRLADCFAALGVKKGECVVFVTANLPETIFSFYALNKIGAIPTLVEPRMAKSRIEHFIKMVKARTVIMLDIVYPKIADILEKHNVEHIIVQNASHALPLIKKIAMRLFTKHASRIKDEHAIKYTQFRHQLGVEPVKEVAYTPNSLAVITQTGGTTGTPKGVKLTNDGLNAVALSFKFTHNDCVPTDRFLNIMPIFTSYGVVCGVHMAFTQRVENILVPNFAPKKFPALMLKHKPHAVIAVPAFYEIFINSKKARRADLSNLKFAVCGGDVLNPKLEEALNAFFKEHGCKYHICQGYGLSETSAVTAFNCIYREKSEGLPLCTSTMGIFDPVTGEELDYGQRGEICVSGPSIMLGYYDNKEETDNVIKMHKDGQLWVHSGDRGYFDEDGFLFFEGRFKFVIPRFDGHKNFPIQIERVVNSYEGVLNCCVVPCKDRKHLQGMYPLVIVEMHDKTISEEDVREGIMKHCKENLEERGQPCDVVLVDKVPLTLVGKNDVTLLKEKYANYDYFNHKL